jgi:hypothetical protein
MRRWIWAILAVLVLISAGGYAAYRNLPERRPDNGTELSPFMRRELAERVVRVLELDVNASRPLLATSNRLVCAARVFGTEPVLPSKVAEVVTAYARVYCAEVLPDGAAGQGVAVPIAMHFRETPQVERPGDGAAYNRDLNRIFPARLRDVVSRDDPAYRDLRAEVERRLADGTSPP